MSGPFRAQQTFYNKYQPFKTTLLNSKLQSLEKLKLDIALEIVIVLRNKTTLGKSYIIGQFQKHTIHTFIILFVTSPSSVQSKAAIARMSHCENDCNTELQILSSSYGLGYAILSLCITRINFISTLFNILKPELTSQPKQFTIEKFCKTEENPQTLSVFIWQHFQRFKFRLVSLGWYRYSDILKA